MIALTTDAGPTLWISPQSPGRAQSNTDGIAAQISAAHHIWEEDVQTYRTYASVQQALKKQIISLFEPMYLDVLNDNMVGFTNISARDMLDHLFSTYGNITAVDLEINFEHMRRAWDPQQPVEALLKQIQDCADYSEAGGVLIGHPQQINVGTAKIFAAGHIEKTWTQFKSHFAAAHRQHTHIQGEYAATAGYYSAKAAVGQNEDQLAEATIGALANLATATAADRGVVATITEANARLVKQLEENSNDLREIKALIKKERVEKRGQHSFNPLLIPQVRPAHKYPNSPWETIHPPGGDNAVCVYPHKVYTAEWNKSLTSTYQCKTSIPSNKLLVTNILTNN
jgi:hypothetical protein